MIMSQEERAKCIKNVSELLMEIIQTPEEIAEKEELSSISDAVEMLTVKECAAMLKGVAPSTIYKMVRTKKLPCVRVDVGESGRMLIPKAAVLDYLNKVYKE